MYMLMQYFLVSITCVIDFTLQRINVHVSFKYSISRAMSLNVSARRISPEISGIEAVVCCLKKDDYKLSPNCQVFGNFSGFLRGMNCEN